jgi:hypothetical protein
MLTIYSTLRGFDDPRANIMQQNAVQSWLCLNPKPEIIIMSAGKGVSRFCNQYKLKNVAVEKNGFQVPYLDDMMRKAERIAKNNYLLLVSGDIILFQETIDALNAIKDKLSMFCMTAIKRETNLNELLDFNSDWKATVKNSFVHFSLPTSGDFFLYKKGFLNALDPIPKFVIGRSGCDSWLLSQSHKSGFLINATEAIPIFHQQHDHSHMAIVDGDAPERTRNLELATTTLGARVDDSNFVLRENFRLGKKVFQTCELDNIYHLCGPKTGSQWFKSFFSAIQDYTNMPSYDLEENRYKWDYRKFTDRLETEMAPTKHIVCPLYMSFDNYLQFPKSSKYKSFCVIRDPRDQLVSFYWSVLYSHAQIGLHSQWRERLSSLDISNGIIECIHIMKEFGIIDAMSSYKNCHQDPCMKVVKFRDVFALNKLQTFKELMNWLEIPIPDEDLKEILEELKFERFSGRTQGNEDNHAHYRKGIIDDWKNYFDDNIKLTFYDITETLVTDLGYEI